VGFAFTDDPDRVVDLLSDSFPRNALILGMT
jgi:hypothetical protein